MQLPTVNEKSNTQRWTVDVIAAAALIVCCVVPSRARAQAEHPSTHAAPHSRATAAMHCESSGEPREISVPHEARSSSPSALGDACEANSYGTHRVAVPPRLISGGDGQVAPSGAPGAPTSNGSSPITVKS